MGYYIPDPYNLNQDHILGEILEDQIHKILNEDAKKAKSKNGDNGKADKPRQKKR
jgi:hypothetical protein